MLELKGISKAFGAIVVASDIDLSLARGEALGIIGPNGAGKSTLLKTIFGYLRPFEGAIAFDGASILGLTPDRVMRSALQRCGRSMARPGNWNWRECLAGRTAPPLARTPPT